MYQNYITVLCLEQSIHLHYCILNNDNSSTYTFVIFWMGGKRVQWNKMNPSIVSAESFNRFSWILNNPKFSSESINNFPLESMVPKGFEAQLRTCDRSSHCIPRAFHKYAGFLPYPPAPAPLRPLFRPLALLRPRLSCICDGAGIWAAEREWPRTLEGCAN